MLDSRRRFLVFLGAASVGGANLATALSDAAQAGASRWSGTAPIAAPPHLLEAWKHARELGKPLLVFIEPDPVRPVHPQSPGWIIEPTGLPLGALLDHATDETLATFALAELACATAAEIRAAFDVACESSDRFVLLELGTPLDEQNPRLCISASGRESVEREPSRVSLRPASRATRWLPDDVRAQAEQLAADVRAALLPKSDTLDKRALAALERLPNDARFVYREGAPNARTPQQWFDRAALALALASGARREADRAAYIEAVATVARERWVDSAPPGAKWAIDAGCGISVDGVGTGPCGTAAVTSRSWRFLVFYGAARAYEVPEPSRARPRNDGMQLEDGLDSVRDA